METKESGENGRFVRLRAWHASLATRGRLACTFAINFLLWLIGGPAMDAMWGETRSLTYHLLSALWMGLFMTLFLDYKLVKSVLRRKKTPSDDQTG